MNEPKPNLIPLEWLAAYADGELDAATRRRVEAWLEEHPEALADLQEQEALSPINREYWELVAPPLPSDAEWSRTLATISCAAAPVERHRPKFLAPLLLLTSLTAAMFLVVLLIDREQPHRGVIPPVVRNDVPSLPKTTLEDEEDMIYRVATADDVELIQLPEAAASLVVVGRHPMHNVPLLLASAGDVHLLNYGPDDQGNLPDIEATRGPDVSMLWTPSSK